MRVALSLRKSIVLKKLSVNWISVLNTEKKD